MKIPEIRKELDSMKDADYRSFQIKLIPSVDPDRVVGVRTPQLRAFAKQLLKDPDVSGFLCDLPHGTFDEYQLHAFIISGIKDYSECIRRVEEFLPYIDNWATCDQLSPAAFRKHKDDLLEHIKTWIRSGKTYIVRFGVGMLMQHYLDEDFRTEYADIVAGICSGEYYVNMMRAWYFATALAKQYEAVLPYIEENRLDVRTHNKSIQKSVESRRLSDQQKEYLKSLRRKERN